MQQAIQDYAAELKAEEEFKAMQLREQEQKAKEEVPLPPTAANTLPGP